MILSIGFRANSNEEDKKLHFYNFKVGDQEFLESQNSSEIINTL
jgi:hypothetical protein